jgi:hypothetical protein
MEKIYQYKHLDKKENLTFENENLDPLTITLQNMTLMKNTRIIPLVNKNNKKYFFMTDYMEPNSIYCSVKHKIYEGKKYDQINFTMYKKINNVKSDIKHVDIKYITNDNSNNENINNENNINNNEIKCDEQNNDIIQIYEEKDNDKEKETDINILIDKFNIFKRGITNRIKYIMKIPNYEDSNVYYSKTEIIYVDKTKKLKNIIEYDDIINNLHCDDVNTILSKCRCKFLFHISSIKISDTDVMLGLKLVRIYPETLDILNIIEKTYILNQIKGANFNASEFYNGLDIHTKTKQKSKKIVVDELKRLIM